MVQIPGRHFLKNLVERRALLLQLVRRDFHQRYVGSAAGWIWGVVNPAVQLAMYYFIFQVCLKVPPPPEAGENYAIFMLAGFLPWMLFSETVIRSASSLVDHSALITKTVFPSEVVPVSILISSFINHLIVVGLMLVAVYAVLGIVSPMLVLLPVYMFLLALLGVGIAWIASSLHVYMRDTGQVLGVLMMVWFWSTPIMISRDNVPEQFLFVFDWNPLTWIVGAYRGRMLTTAWPDLSEFAIIAAYSIGAFVLGGLFFRHLKRGFADVL